MGEERNSRSIDLTAEKYFRCKAAKFTVNRIDQQRRYVNQSNTSFQILTLLQLFITLRFHSILSLLGVFMAVGDNPSSCGNVVKDFPTCYTLTYAL